MAVPAVFPHEDAIRSASERRLSIAIGISLVVHALAIASLRGVLPSIYTYAQGGVGSLTVLQAVLAGPKSEPVPEPPPPEPAIEPALLVPPGTTPLEAPVERPPPQTGPLQGGGPTRSGPASPDVSVAVGLIEDPARLGPGYAARLAQRFPERVSKPPQLLGSPVVMYPAAAMASGIERRVAVLITLDAKGGIVDSQMIPDDPLFGPVVKEALRNAQFTPAEIDMATVPYWAIVEFVFSLTRADAPAPPPRSARARAPFRQPSVGR
jgi:hypothetical protein